MFSSGQERLFKNLALDGIDTDDMVSSRVVVHWVEECVFDLSSGLPFLG